MVPAGKILKFVRPNSNSPQPESDTKLLEGLIKKTSGSPDLHSIFLSKSSEVKGNEDRKNKLSVKYLKITG